MNMDYNYITLNNIEKQFKTVGQAVEELLRKNERARNEDKYLSLLYHRGVQGIDIRIPPEDYERLVSWDIITRCRRKLQEEAENKLKNQLINESEKIKAIELLPTDPRVWRLRRLRADLIRKFMPQWKPLSITSD